MGVVVGSGFDRSTSTAWCEIEATASRDNKRDTCDFTLQLPDGYGYVTHSLQVVSENRKHGHNMSLTQDNRLQCHVWAEYNDGTFGGKRSWEKTRFNLVGAAENGES